MRHRLRRMVLVLAFIAAACDTRPGGARTMLPDVPNTKIIEGQTITQFISSLVGGAALKATYPALFAVVEFTEQVATCYQDIGAVAMRVYSDKDFPLSSGVVAIIDRNATTDPRNFVGCLSKGPQQFAAPSPPTLQPCLNSYTLKKDNNEFYIAYAGTTKEICQAFCSKLEGCVESQK